jgi:hypothetical protein
MKSRLTQKEIPDEAPNHLARRQSSTPGCSLQRHSLVTGQEHGQFDHVIIQTTDLLSLGIDTRL